MNLVASYFSAPEWRVPALSLAHSLWLGGALALALGFLLRRIPAQRAQCRYFLSLGALGAFVAGTAITFSVLQFVPTSVASTKQGPPNALIEKTGSIMEIPPPAGSNPHLAGTQKVVANTVLPNSAAIIWVPWVCAFWGFGASLMLVRLACQWIGLQSVRSRCLPVDPNLTGFVNDWAARLGIRQQIRVLQSNAIITPSVYGIFMPVLLLPAACLAGVPHEYLRAILLHELAHIHRFDFLVNMLQGLVEALFFFNPAVWWINHQIRREREACCDLLAVEHLGERITYARALTNWAERVHGASLAPAWTGNSPGSLVERLKRLLSPGMQPPLRLPWYTFSSAVLLSILILAVFWSGTRGAFLVAAEILSPAQRVEKIQELTQEISPPRREYGPGDRITIVGTVRTEDGSDLPVKTSLGALTLRPSLQGWNGVRIREGRFSNTLEYGQIYLRATVAGVPRGLFGPLTTAPGGVLSNLNLVISNGIPATVQVTAKDGKPVAGATVTGGYQHPADTGFPRSWKTDSDGKMNIPHWLGLPLNISVEAAHFQYAEFPNVQLDPRRIHRLELLPSQPYQGRVVAHEGGSPVAGAEIRLCFRSGRYPVNMARFEDAKVIALTDADGAFELNTLPDSSSNTLVVQKPGFSPLIWRDVQPGHSGVTIPLQKQVMLRGRLTGDLSQLEGYPDNPVVQVRVRVQPFPDRDDMTVTTRAYPVAIKEGEGSFSITDLFPGSFKLVAGRVKKQIDLGPETPVLEIDLNAPSAPKTNEANQAAAGATREVVFKFKVPEAVPPPTASFRVHYYREGDSVYKSRDLSITNTEARLLIPVPGVVSWEPKDLPGYWLAPNSHPVPAGSGPEEIAIALIPAGAIHGTVVGENGEEIGGVLVSVVVADRSSLLPEGVIYHPTAKDSSSTEDGPTRFVARPLVFGGQYGIVAHRENTYVCSPVFSITGKNPIQTVRLQLPKNTASFSVQLLDEQDRPLAGQRVSLLYEPHLRFAASSGRGLFFPDQVPGFSSQEVRTDRDGIASFPGINPEAPGNYFAISQSRKDFIPSRTTLSLSKMLKSPKPIWLTRGKILAGTLVDSQDGRPVSSRSVYAMRIGHSDQLSFEAEGKSTADGKFVFSNLAAGTYVLAAGGTLLPDRITIAESKTTQTFQFERWRTISSENE